MKNTPLKRRRPLRRKPGPSLARRFADEDDPAWSAAARRFYRVVTASQRCVMCAAYPLPRRRQRDLYGLTLLFEAHHVIPKRFLRHLGPDVAYDPDNGLALCVYHHQQHTEYAQRVPRTLVPRRVDRFAARHDLAWLLDREAPPGDAR